ncbi:MULTISPECIES: hypothetical protein [unclassified Microbacterium]|uniref:hypothetical protein n=1 Tax=unclassified Microbacterium TaxID=2609290 RepID=UPI002882FAD4|nr:MULTISPECIES: hypothetical protein [unclassified Microbacterium]
MSDSGNRKTAAELDDALRLLDHELNGLHLEQPMQIRAIGGYALLKHGVRKGDMAYTVDIDTVTKDYSAEVIAAIETVAERLGLDSDFINNYNLMDEPEHVEQMLDAEWLPQPMGLRNIAVSIASIETLTRAKIIAADTASLSGRDRDTIDLQALLDHQGITTMRQFNASYPDPYGEYPEAQEIVAAHFPGGARSVPSLAGMFPELQDVELDPYGLGEDVDDYVDDTSFYR